MLHSSRERDYPGIEHLNYTTRHLHLSVVTELKTRFISSLLDHPSYRISSNEQSVGWSNSFSSSVAPTYLPKCLQLERALLQRSSRDGQ